MHAPTINKSINKTPLAKLQATFHKHRRHIDLLKSQLEQLKNECQQALTFYHSDLKPKKNATGELITRFILRVQDLTKNPKALTKNEKKALNNIFEDSLNLVFSFLEPRDIHADLKELYKDIHGEGWENDFYEGLSDLKEMLKEHGVDDIDLSDLNPNDSMQEMLAKCGQAMRNRQENEEVTEAIPPTPTKKKSKKELLKEKKAQELIALQNKSLNSIYKRLAKELHPDLEQDSEKRTEKVTLMKRLTVAYDNQDLISLLAIESEWLGRVDMDSTTLNEENLKAFNLLLKDQIEDLKYEMNTTYMHPRYIDIHRFIKDCPEEPLRAVQNAVSECDDIYQEYIGRLNDLNGKNPLQFLKKALSSYTNADDEFDDIDMLMKLIMRK